MYNIFNLQDVTVRSERILFIEVNRILSETRICYDAYGILRAIVEIFRYYSITVPEDVLEAESKLILKDEIPFSKQEAMTIVYCLIAKYERGFAIDMVRELFGGLLRFYLSEERIHVSLNSSDYLNDLRKEMSLKKDKISLMISKEFFLLVLMEGLNSDMKSKDEIKQIFANVERAKLYDLFALKVLSQDVGDKKEIIDGKIVFNATGIIEDVISGPYEMDFNLISRGVLNFIVSEISQYSVHRVTGRYDERGLVSSVIKNRLSVLKNNLR